MTFRTWSVALLVLAACTSEPAPQKPPETPPPAESKAPEAPKDQPLQMTKEQLEGGHETIALVPSIVETQKALEQAGIQTKLVDLIPKDRKLDEKTKDKDNVAVRTGVVIADMLLTVKTSPKPQLMHQLDLVKSGMETLGGGADIQSTINDIQERVKSDAVTRDSLLKELDELSGAVIPELEFNGENRIVPLIQAGSWLEGANLVAKAVKASNNPGAADALLKQPAVVEYFIKYVKTEGKDKAPAAITEKLSQSLETLKGLANKTDAFTMADIDSVVKTTDDVLALL